MPVNYCTYAVEDFVMDEFFHAWITHPDAAADVFWYEWLLNYPHKRREIEEARQIIVSFNHTDSRERYFDQQTEHELNRLHHTISDLEQKIRNSSSN